MAKKLAWCFLGLVIAFAILILVGMIPVNNSFLATEDGIEILLISNPVHADIVMPIETEGFNWREMFPGDHFGGDVSKATHVAIGWGDKGFYIGTPTWSEFKISTASYAMLWPSSTCLHVVMLNSNEFADARSVKLSPQQYGKLVKFVRSSFQTNQKKPVQIDGESYSSNDAFYEALGSYHLLNTCNSWVGRAIRSAGVRCGWLTPLPKTTFLYLPNNQTNKR